MTFQELFNRIRYERFNRVCEEELKWSNEVCSTVCRTTSRCRKRGASNGG
jgi:hypothetical protein